MARQIKFAGRTISLPESKVLRLTIGTLLMFGGLLWFLPILGIWMLPLGLLILALDVPLLERPVGSIIVRLQHWLATRRRKKAERKSQAE